MCKQKSPCEIIIDDFKLLINYAINNLEKLALVFFVLGVVFLMLGPFFEKDLFTASGSLFTASTLLYAIYSYQKDAKEKNSKFYLEQIQKYFSGYSELNINCEPRYVPVTQNNIIWHKVIDALKATESLREKITEKSHIEIYLTDYIITAYSLIVIISKIDSYQFFFGVGYNNYHGVPPKHEDKTLYDMAKKNSISPKSLYFLACFLDRAGKIRYDVDENGIQIINCIDKEYFKKIDKNYDEFTQLFTGAEVIKKYIDIYEKLEIEEAKKSHVPT